MQKRGYMSQFKIITNTTADLPSEFIAENNLGLVHFNYILDEVSYGAENELDWKEFYRLMREEEKMPTTSQVNPDQYKEIFEKYLKENKELLYLSFSSGLSGSCQNAHLAAREVMEENPEAKIVVVDTLCASMGEGLLVYKALQMQKDGLSIDEVKEKVEELVPHLVHIVTADDLFHLHRGGRVNKASAVVGTIVGIKPIIHVNDEGKLIAIGKCRGRKKSLLELVNYMEKNMGSYADKNDIIFISHGDAYEDACFVKEEITKRFGIKDFMIHNIGPTIGAHSGPGTIALFFEGEQR